MHFDPDLDIRLPQRPSNPIFDQLPSQNVFFHIRGTNLQRLVRNSLILAKVFYNLKKDEIVLRLKNVLQLDNDINRTNTRPRSCSISNSNVESAGKRRLLSNKIRINNKMSINK